MVPISITNGYCSEQEALEAIYKGQAASAEETALLDIAVEAASRQIDEYCNRRFYLDASATARVYAPDSWYYCKIDDVGDITGFALATDENNDQVYETVWDSSQYQLEIANATSLGRPYTSVRARRARIFPVLYNSPWLTSGSNYIYIPEFARDYQLPSGLQSVQITAKWGWPSVPLPVKQATIIQASMLLKGADAPFGVAGSVDVGQIRITQQLHPLAKALVTQYRDRASGVFL